MSLCEFCGEEAIPGAPGVSYFITGWERLRTKDGGANMVHLRHRSGQIAHDLCVDAAKPRQVARRRAEGPTLDVTKRYAPPPAIT